MGILDFLKGPDINEVMLKYHQLKYAVIVDLRDEEDFSKGRIPGSINVPLNNIGKVIYEVEDRNVPVFVCGWYLGDCKKGASALRSLGYSSVTILGECERYTGEIEKDEE